MLETDRRKFPRVEYPCHLTLWKDDGANETWLANTKNVSLGGLCVHLNEGMSVGTKVVLQLNFPNTTVPFRCAGKVVRFMPETGKLYNIGIKFEPLNELKKGFLSEKIADLKGRDGLNRPPNRLNIQI